MLVFIDGAAKQVTENLTVTDYIAAKDGLVGIYRLRERFERLLFDEGAAFWVPVKEAHLLGCSEGMAHV